MKTSNSALVSLFELRLGDFVEAFYPASHPLREEMHYILLGGGKRARPQLSLLSCMACGADLHHALPAAIAVEMIHSYSLVHDDLPCMDDDQMRRGKPTAHVKFGEDRALLAGDGLLTDAFGYLASHNDVPWSSGQRLEIIRELAQAAGGAGMVAGQALDLYWTKRVGATLSNLQEIHTKKTAHLIAAACVMGGLAAGAGREAVERLRKIGAAAGHAFQIIDDLLDEKTGIGKTSGKDQKHGKLTYPALVTRQDAEKYAQSLTEAALSETEKFGVAGELLRVFLTELLRRVY